MIHATITKPYKESENQLSWLLAKAEIHKERYLTSISTPNFPLGSRSSGNFKEKAEVKTRCMSFGKDTWKELGNTLGR